MIQINYTKLLKTQYDTVTKVNQMKFRLYMEPRMNNKEFFFLKEKDYAGPVRKMTNIKRRTCWLCELPVGKY